MQQARAMLACHGIKPHWTKVQYTRPVGSA